MELWYKLDDTFGEPKGTILFEMHTERDEGITIRDQILMEVLAQILSVSLREPLYSASKAGLEYQVSTDSRFFFQMQISGYNQYLPRFFTAVVNRSLDVITNPNSEDIVYEHTGEPLDIDNLKIVLIDPFTGNEVENIGPNSSIYFTVNQQLQFQNTNQKKN